MPKLRVFLAEDHRTIREGLKLILNAQDDMEVVGEADDGATAVERARELQPDIAIMDISMPVMNGLQATARLTACCPTTKVIALTRHADEGYLQQLLAAGASGFVLKQSAPSELLEAIRAVAGGQKHVDRSLTHKLIAEYAQKPGQAPPEPSHLTPREEEVLRLAALGYTNKEVAARLDVSVKTVEAHKAKAMNKLGMHSRIQLVRYAMTIGWLTET